MKDPALVFVIIVAVVWVVVMLLSGCTTTPDPLASCDLIVGVVYPDGSYTARCYGD